MDTVTSQDGTTIAYDRSGDGPVVITVAGAFANRSFAPAAPSPLGPDFTAVVYDRRGRNDSGDTAPYAVEREIEDLDALITALGGSAGVFGMSSGAVLALEAARQGVPITELALYEPPFIVDDSRPPTPVDYVPHLEELVASGRRGDAVEYFMTAAVGMPAEVVAPMRAMPMWPGLEAVAHTLAYDGAVMGDTMRGVPESIQRFASVRVPTLVLDGGASPAFQREAVRMLADILPHGERRTLEGQTHDVSMEVLAPVLRDFFAH
jgi:pimeloyl-ACP methyl ester carboxylesterase